MSRVGCNAEDVRPGDCVQFNYSNRSSVFIRADGRGTGIEFGSVPFVNVINGHIKCLTPSHAVLPVEAEVTIYPTTL